MVAGLHDVNEGNQIEGQNKFGSNVQILHSKRVHIHPEFSRLQLANDIALIELETEAHYNENVQPVCMPPKNFHLADGAPAFVSGFGYTKYRGSLPSTLHIVNVPLLSTNHCQEMYNKAQIFRKITDNVVCAGYAEGGKDSCEVSVSLNIKNKINTNNLFLIKKGDSGGPLQVKIPGTKSWTLVGLVSNGVRCAEPNLPGIYTRVNKYLPWIEQVS